MDRVIPVVVIREIGDTIPTLGALCAGGIHTAEITFRTSCAEEAIRAGVRAFPEMEIGAGTVINGEQCRAALAAGAKFIVSPGLDPDVAAICREAKIPYYPGCVTPTEIMRALSLGLTTLKFFPANVYGGLAAIKALSAPFPQVRFIPTGGIGLSNLREYLDCESVFAVGGSFMMKGNITENCKEVVRLL